MTLTDVRASRRQLLLDGAGIAVSVLRLRARLWPGGPECGLLRRRRVCHEPHRLLRGCPVRRHRLHRRWPAVARRRPADRPSERAPSSLLGRARAVVGEPPADPARRGRPLPERRGIRAQHFALPQDRASRPPRLLDRRDPGHVHPVEPRDDRRNRPRGSDPRAGTSRARRRLPSGDGRIGGRADRRPARPRRCRRRRLRSPWWWGSPSIASVGIIAGGILGPIVAMVTVRAEPAADLAHPEALEGAP